MGLSGIQIFNTALRLIAAVHLTFGVYSMLKAVIPPEVLEIDSAFSGKFKYLTFWSVVSILCAV